MSWLRGRRVLVTRPRSQAEGLAQGLRDLGAVPVLCPTIEVRGPESTERVDAALSSLAEYDAVVFTSANGVAWTLRQMEELDLGADAWKGIRVMANGPATANALEKNGIAVRFIPNEYRSERIAEALDDVQGARVLLLRADIARQALPDRLAKGGVEVDDVVVYRTVTSSPAPSQIEDVRAGVDIITFTSPSSVRGFVAILGPEHHRVSADALIATIGPVTSDAARGLGFHVDVEAVPYTSEGLVAALAAHYQQGPATGVANPAG